MTSLPAAPPIAPLLTVWHPLLSSSTRMRSSPFQKYTSMLEPSPAGQYLSKDGQAAFAADISTTAFRLLQATQRPFDADSFGYPTWAAAWKTIPSWALVAGSDKAIPPACERWMYQRANARKIVEVPGTSHVAMLSHPQIVANLIDEAARATS